MMRSMAPVAGTNREVTLTFPGQGSYSHAVLRELYSSYPQTIPYFHQANDIGRELLNGDFLSLVTATSQNEHDLRLNACPDLDQIGIYVTEMLIAGILIESGVKPALLVGHSFGELAALATGGAYSFETGLRIVCQRVLALRSMAKPGIMAAVSCDWERAKKHIDELGNNSIEISVINHPRQTVLSGAPSELEALRTILNRQAVSLTFLKSKYAYHSSFLAGAVTPFRTSLEACDFRPANIPVFLCMEEVLYSPGADLAQILSSQFIRPLNFRNVVATLYDSGYRTFIECGAGDIVTSLIKQNLAERASAIVSLPLATQEVNLQEGLLKVFDLGFGTSETTRMATEIVGPSGSEGSAQLLKSMSLVVSDMSRLIENTSRLVELVSDSVAVTRRAGSPGVKNDSAAGAAGPADEVHQKPVLRTDSSSNDSLINKRSPIDTTGISGAAPVPNGSKEFAAQPAIHPGPRVRGREECVEAPVAIVSMGCVLPGAQDPEQYWSNILNGVSGISNLADIDPSAARDFLAGNDGAQIRVTPDKTYTLLHGCIRNLPYDDARLSKAYNRDQFDSLTRGQKLLALAIVQSLSRLKAHVIRSGSGRIQCILGATADGSTEYDDALFSESLETLIRTIDEPETLRRDFTHIIEEISGYKSGDSEKLTQHKIFGDVVERLLGSGIQTYVVDTACSSSLYSIYLGMKALQDHDSDIIVAGGVFAPGPANNTLFAQFKGLTPRQSRPFDASADGVVFGDGAGIVILKRLTDALSHGDRILAVIRGVGLSSDGRSPSINVPQVKGQCLAIRNAYEHSGIDMNTVQYVEAHATATLVGDAVEFNALKDVMKRDPASRHIELGSVKALVGHTGWVAGMASVIKICKAFESKMIPRQYNYVEPSREIDLAHSHFTISEASHPWPANVDSYPRRAAINGFGFGGTNAHLILEDFDETYHTDLCSHLSVSEKISNRLAVVSVAGLFPGADGSVGDSLSSQLRFRRESLHLPAKKMLLPDVTEHMDASQYLAALAAEKAFSTMPAGWMRFKSVTGVVLGLESKTERGKRANERIFADRLRRELSEHNGNSGLSSGDLNRILTKLIECIRTRNIPSGPYTLPGLMPNVAAGRIANMFDLNGPNIVVDMGSNSLLQSLFIARQLLVHNDCKIVLAGGMNASSVDDGSDAEAAFLLALTTPETASEEGFPVLGTIDLSEPNDADPLRQEISEINPGLNYKGARGAPEILRAIHQASEESSSCGLAIWQNGSAARSRRLVFAQPSLPRKLSSSESKPQADSSGTYAYVQGTPIRCYSPRLAEATTNGVTKVLKDRRILFLTDQADHWLALERSGALAAFEYTVLCAAGARLANSLPIDLTSDESVKNSLSGLAKIEFDTLIAIKTLEGHAKETLLMRGSESELTWIDLLFAACRHSYERIQSKNIPVIALCLGAFRDAQLDPYTGLASGFMKSLSRELNGPLCRMINTDEINLYKALRHVEIELGHPGDEVEVCYKEGARSTFALIPVKPLTKDDRPYLDSDSVVIATGGARGVTAVLVEELLRSFGCRVIAIGRTDPCSSPENVRGMDEQAFKDYEPQFYKDELARNKAKKITDLKREYLAHRAANEVCRITKQLEDSFGKYEYQSVDITSATAVDEFVKATYEKYGRVDLVLHGAGIQVSKALTKKSLPDFREIIATKLGGLRNLYNACREYGNGRRSHFHLLTSVFSYMGNDGQPDYGAANEAMGRIAACMNSPDSGNYWSSMAWLGWAGIGMTRDSEFAALAASRGLRGVTKEEGQQIFSAIMKGAPATPINVLLAEGEIEYYKVAIQIPTPGALPPVPSPARIKQEFHVMEREISIESAPYLLNHLVDGIPTLPGALVIALFGEAAQQLRPDLKIISFEKAVFRRFVKVYKNRKTRLRVEARIVSEDDRQTVVQVRILSDFVHSSGLILQKNILQHEILIRMSPTPLAAPKGFDLNGVEGRTLLDPYMMDGSPVSLSGPFNAMKNIIVGGTHRRADFKIADFNGASSEYKSVLSKIVLMDSLWRFGVIQIAPDNSLPVFVPEECKVMKVYFDFSAFDASQLTGTVTFSGANPRLDGDLLTIGPVVATDVNGNTLLVVEDGVCRRFGAVGNGASH